MSSLNQAVERPDWSSPAPVGCAPLHQRAAAFGVDCLVVAGYAALLGALVVTAGRLGLIDPAAAFTRPWAGQLTGLLLLTAPAVCYFALFESSARCATPGKRRFGLRVVGQGGGRPTRGQAFLRSIGKLAPWELSHAALWWTPGWPRQVESLPTGVVVVLCVVWALIALYALGALISRRNRTMYDRLAGTAVVVDWS